MDAVCSLVFYCFFFCAFFSAFGFEVSLPLRYYSAILQCVRYIVSTDFLRLERPHAERPMEYLGCDEDGLAKLILSNSLNHAFLRLFPSVCHIISIHFCQMLGEPSLLFGAAHCSTQSCPMGFDLLMNRIGMSRE